MKKPQFMGEYEVSIDSKKRIVIPSKWRDKLDMKIVISEDFDKVAAIRSHEEFGIYCEDILSEDRRIEENRNLARRIMSSANEINLDKWYRFVIPQKLMSMLEAKSTLVLVGVGSYIEVWAKEKFEQWKDDPQSGLEAISKKAKS